MPRTISNFDDVIDSRDVIDRIEELEGERDSWLADPDADDSDWAAVNVDDAEELATLKALASEGEDYAADWTHGETLIRDSYFVEYAQELAEDIGAINHEASWPNTCIDWDQAARELRMDYTAVEFGDVTYWIR
jgi:hypothetical protein